eukprot:m.17163 g.17163  ORF g.17163 m.17163 type:complete len:76 (-) comp7349_c0_seq1:256-483(-)
MSKAQAPELKKFLDKRLELKLNANRRVTGVLRGFDPFMNIVVDEAFERRGEDTIPMGTVVIRGNSIVTMQALEGM